MARSVASSNTNSAAPEFVGWGHETLSPPRSNSSVRVEHKAIAEDRPAVAPRASPSPNNSGLTKGHTPLPEGLRTASSRRGSLHHED